MTTNQLHPTIGATLLLTAETLSVEVIIRDAKMSYGRARFLVSPIAGRGEQWVELSRLAPLPVIEVKEELA